MKYAQKEGVAYLVVGSAFEPLKISARAKRDHGLKKGVQLLALTRSRIQF
jgi:hypothetical protein